MVPVRKPGRPLSACPHGQMQSCTCGGVTAAIPRKQTCRCGGDTPASTPPVTQVNSAAITEIPSPTKVAFKVQKSSRPSSNRKSSIGAGNVERMDLNNVNIVSMDSRLQDTLGMPNGYAVANNSTYHPQPLTVEQISPSSMQTPRAFNFNGNGNGPANGHRDLATVAESTSMTPAAQSNGGTNENHSCCCAPAATKTQPIADIPAETSSCCAPKHNNHSRIPSSSTASIDATEATGTCCSSNHHGLPKQKSIGTAPSMGIFMHQPGPPLLQSYSPAYLPPYFPHPTIYSYPPSYGSYQHPLQPTEWRNSVRAMTYSQPQIPLPQNAYGAPMLPDNLDTIHSCGCGDTCQCVGCAAHPYNDATQNYVRSAWSSMMTASPTEQHSNEVSNTNGHNDEPKPAQTTETAQSPTAQTPSSTTSANGEEQSLSATDFFFVNYPFTADGCGGDTQSCPCGDECECLGCTIHRGPAAQELEMQCAGADAICPCGDDCQCIGCSIHKTAPVEA